MFFLYAFPVAIGLAALLWILVGVVGAALDWRRFSEPEYLMQDSKPWYLSLTVWGVLVGLLATAVQRFGYVISTDLQADISQQLLSLAQAIAYGVALYGRVRATKVITSTPGSTVPVMLLTLVFVTGCSTSRPFQEGAAVVGTRIATNADKYVTADTTISPDVQLDRQAKVQELRTATADPDTVAYEVVATVWPPVRVFYVPYVEGDPRFTDAPALKENRLRTVKVMDGLVAAEQIRRLVLGLFGDEGVKEAAAAATQPATP
jgi:hypothetical protein